MIRGAIFDLDGVLLDSMGIWKDLGARYLRSLHIQPEPGLNEILFAMSMEQGAAYLKEHYPLPQSEAEIGEGIARMLEDYYFYEVPAKPGAAALLNFLAERGIQVDERIVPRSAELPPMGMERDLEEEQTLAAALLGDGLTREERSGEVYVYEGERGLLQCHSSGEFWADFQSGAFPVPEGAEMAEHALETMELLHFQGEVVSSAGNAQDGSVTLRQLWNGVPVLPCRATLVYEGGELKRIEEGRRLTGTPQTTAGTPITATTALMRFYAGLSERMDICSEVREIEIAYTLSNALGGPISLIPVWHITTDTEIYELNTLDGSLAAAGAEETERTEQ